MKKLIAFWLTIVASNAFSNVFLGIEYGKSLIQNNDQEEKNEGSLLGASLYKRIIYKNWLLDAGVKYQKIEHKIDYNSGPYYSGDLKSNLLLFKISPGYYLTKNFGLTLENHIFEKKIQVAENIFQNATTGLGVFYEKRVSDSFLAKTSLSYNRGWNSEKVTDSVIIEISLGYGTSKSQIEGAIPESRRIELEEISKKIINYEFNEFMLSDKDQKTLTAVIAVLNNSKYKKIIIEGHSDKHGSDKINDFISLLRAKAVEGYLSFNGIDDSMMLSVGKGKRELIDLGEGRVSNQKNRRVILKIEFDTSNDNYKKLLEIK